MDKENLKNALVIVIEENYSPYLHEPNHTFSQQFEKKMNRLIRQEKQPFWRYTNTVPKRLALTVLAIAFILSGLFIGSSKARNAAMHLIHIIECKHNNLDYETDDSNPIEKAVYFTTIPEGLTEVNYQKSQMSIRITYQDAIGNTITIDQGINPAITIDTEMSVLKRYVGGKSVDLYVPQNNDPLHETTFAVWPMGQYTVQLHATGNISEEQILSWISMIELEK